MELNKNLKSLNIISATREELYEIAAFLNNCWKTEYSKIISPDYLDAMNTDARYDRLLERFDKKTSNFLVMRDSDRLIGVAIFGKSCIDNYPYDGEITSVYLHHDYIGRGYGHTLFTKAETELSAQKYTYFILDVFSDNLRAISFYQKHGYEKVAEKSIKLGEKDYPLSVFRKKHL